MPSRSQVPLAFNGYRARPLALASSSQNYLRVTKVFELCRVSFQQSGTLVTGLPMPASRL